jgi:hypothetical protein
MVAQAGYSVLERSRGQVAPCAICTWHVETRSTCFLVEPQNQGRRFVSGLASKPLGRFSLVWPQNQWATVSSGLASKPAAMVFTGLASKPVVTVCEWFGLKTTRTVSSSLASKPAATVFFSLASKLVVTISPGLASKPVVGFLVEPQNQGGGGFPGLGLKTGNSGLVIWASKSPRRLMRTSILQLQSFLPLTYVALSHDHEHNN